MRRAVGAFFRELKFERASQQGDVHAARITCRIAYNILPNLLYLSKNAVIYFNSGSKTLLEVAYFCSYTKKATRKSSGFLIYSSSTLIFATNIMKIILRILKF